MTGRPSFPRWRFFVVFVLCNIFWGLYYIPAMVWGFLGGSLDYLWPCVRQWGRFTDRTLRRLGITSSIKGIEKLPADGRFILVGNHQATWESFVPAFYLPHRMCYVAKKELLFLPFLGWYLSLLMIVIDRRGGRRVLKKMTARARKLMADRHPIVIFPQGTRGLPGTWRPFHTGVYFLAKALDVPVYTAAHNAGSFWTRSGPFYKGQIRMEILDSFDVRDFKNAKAFTSALEGVIRPAVADLEAPYL